MDIRLKFFAGLIAALATVSVSHATVIGTMGMKHLREMKVRPDGNYDIICIDGEAEIRTPTEFQAGTVCTHIQDFSGGWVLAEGGIQDGMRMCDLEMSHTTGKNKITHLEIGFAAPCGGEKVKSEDCNGYVCSVQLGDKFYSLDFTVRNRVTLTRLSDNFQAVYSGTTPGRDAGFNPYVRIDIWNGVEGIVQASNDGGQSWLPVCDDGFDLETATVICKQLGYAVDVRPVWKSSTRIIGSDIYGLDDLSCNGTEASIFDCPGAEWGREDCSDYEHVTLTCE